MQDKSGMFSDFNFKLIVINSLLEENVDFLSELEALNVKYVSDYEWHSDQGIIPEVLEFFENLVIKERDLKKVTELCFDGGNDVYFYLLPDWNGENDCFDIKSIQGFENLTNLKRVNWYGMCFPEILEPFRKKGIEVIT